MMPSIVNGQEYNLTLKTHFTQNTPDGKCGWATLESLLRHNSIKVSENPLNQRAAGSVGDIERFLIKHKIEYDERWMARDDSDRFGPVILACKAGFGCLISLKMDRSLHAVAVVGIDPIKIRYVDPNFPTQIHEHRRKNIDWYGTVITVYPDVHSKKKWVYK